LNKKTTVEAMSHGAFSIAKQDDGKKLFIENACPEDELEYEIYDDRKDFAYATITKLLKTSSQRNPDPKCKVHKICGSCQWQHINYPEQLKHKRKNLIDLLQEAKVTINELEIPELIGMQEPWNFRNKVIYPMRFIKSTQRVIAGYYKTNSNELINIKYCPIQYSIFDEIIEKLKDLLTATDFDKNILRHVLLRANSKQDEILLSLIIRDSSDETLTSLKTILQRVTELFPIIKTTSLNFNNNSTNVILGSKTEIVQGSGFINEVFQDLKLKISTESFFQVNNKQFAKIIDYIEAQFADQDKILDAYCGIGTISLALAKKKQNLNIIGIEIVKQAIIDAQSNCQENNIKANYICAKLEDKIEDFKKEKFDCVIINPPRKGCSNKILDNLGLIASTKIIYISCNPSTLARDLKYLEKFNYQIEKIQGFDMFPHSFHFETVAILKKQ
jgi:23S rRNA (uracil1939-C5)-methyltransferase